MVNTYDPCVANKMVNGKQMTVCWHVDDLKVLYMNPGEITIFGEWLDASYGVTVTTHRGKVHNYLGIIFDYLKKGKVMINMIEYIKNIITDFPEEITAIRTSPAVDHLFTVRDEALAKPLLEEQPRAFHHTMAQLLFLSARARLLGVQYFGTYFREETFSCFLLRVSILPFQPPIILSRNIAISSGKYEARIAIFRIFAAVDRFSRISRKVGKPLKKIKFCILTSFS